MVAELFQSNGWTDIQKDTQADRNDAANSLSSQYLRTRLKTERQSRWFVVSALI